MTNRAGNSSRPEDIKYVKIAGQKVRVALALDPVSQNQGLSGRPSLPESEGMLFVFANPGRHQFWMKDMNFPIDMLWLGEGHEVIYIKKNALPELYPETYGPAADAKYVLEVVSGFADKYGIKEGDRAEFIY